MSLPASQQQVLDMIESELAAGDPGLAAEFAPSGGGLSCPQGPWLLCPPKPPGRRRRSRWPGRLVSRFRADQPRGGPAS